MRFVDLSVHLDNETPLDPAFLRPKIEYKDHQGGLKDMFNMYGITPDQLPDGEGLAAETVTITTHSGTHIDAPWHYHPTMNNGEKAWTIDEVPLDWFFRPGVKIDLTHLPNGTIVKPHHIEEALAKINLPQVYALIAPARKHHVRRCSSGVNVFLQKSSRTNSD